MHVGEKQKVYAKWQESRRKDVERAFGRLHKKWLILKHPGMANAVEHLNAIWGCCIILHNMTLRDQETKKHERKEVTEYPTFVASGELGNLESLRDPAYLAAHSVTTMIKKRAVMENQGAAALKHGKLLEHVYKHSKTHKLGGPLSPSPSP